MLNRAALIVRPRQPYIDWALGLDDSGLAPQPEDEKTVYLVPDCEYEEDQDEVLKRVFAEVFERELEAWYTDEKDWPQGRTFAMFKRWFKIELHSVVEDLCSEPLVDDEADGAVIGKPFPD